MSDHRTPTERFWAFVDIRVDGCWEWTGSLNDKGYGNFWDGERVVKAHRYAYLALIGPIAGGLQTDHLCRNRACVRPDHLEVVTSRENTMRGATVAARHARKTHCDHGHEFTEANTYTVNGERICRACRRRRSNASYRRTREAR